MYCLKVEKIKNGNASDSLVLKEVADISYMSYDNFRDLYEQKQIFDRKGNRYYSYKTTVYKVSNNGVRIEELADTNLYKEVENVENELKKSLTSYSYLRKVLSMGKKKYYVENSKKSKNDVLVISPKSLKLEIEKTKTTPKYEVRQNGKLLFVETAQNEIVTILKRDYGIALDE